MRPRFLKYHSRNEATRLHGVGRVAVLVFLAAWFIACGAGVAAWVLRSMGG